jgi:uncharacterized protein (DUF488 family)
MESILYTIGFTQKTAEQFFQLLADAGVTKVVDIRENRVGQLQGFARFPDIAYFLRRIVGAEYVYEPSFAPTPEIRKAYRSTRDWNQYESSFRALMTDRNAIESVKPEDYQGKVAFLCSEPFPEKCHRRLVAELLAEKCNAAGHTVEVKHLVIPKPLRTKKKRGRANDRADPV